MTSTNCAIDQLNHSLTVIAAIVSRAFCAIFTITTPIVWDMGYLHEYFST